MNAARLGSVRGDLSVLTGDSPILSPRSQSQSCANRADCKSWRIRREMLIMEERGSAMSRSPQRPVSQSPPLETDPWYDSAAAD